MENKILEELRQKLNHEIEKNNHNLRAPAVVQLSKELDAYIVSHYLLAKRA